MLSSLPLRKHVLSAPSRKRPIRVISAGKARSLAVRRDLSTDQRQSIPPVATWPRNGVRKAKAKALHLLLPFHNFGSSVFNTPALLFLRLFYHASSFDPEWLEVEAQAQPFSITDLRPPKMSPNQKLLPTSTSMAQKDVNKGFLEIEDKMQLAQWLRRLSASLEQGKHYQVVSLTWVKALGSPLSHEFLQFIVEDVRSRNRNRLLADRHVDGDWVFVGSNRTAEAALDRHSLPMPLLSLTYSDITNRPSVSALAKILSDVSSRKPNYSLLREMCWWYAETVFEAARSQLGGELKEWQWASLRYSFVVRTALIPRRELTSHAEEFVRQNSEEMSY